MIPWPLFPGDGLPQNFKAEGYLLAGDEAAGGSCILFLVGNIKELAPRLNLYIAKSSKLIKPSVEDFQRGVRFEPGGSFSYAESLIKYVNAQVERSHLRVFANMLGVIAAPTAKTAAKMIPDCYTKHDKGGGKNNTACAKCRYLDDCGYDNAAYVQLITPESDDEIIKRVREKMRAAPWKD